MYSECCRAESSFLKEKAMVRSFFIVFPFFDLEGYSWPEDREHCEEEGRMMLADPSKVTKRAKKRGLSQLGTLGES